MALGVTDPSLRRSGDFDRLPSSSQVRGRTDLHWPLAAFIDDSLGDALLETRGKI